MKCSTAFPFGFPKFSLFSELVFFNNLCASSMTKICFNPFIFSNSFLTCIYSFKNIITNPIEKDLSASSPRPSNSRIVFSENNLLKSGTLLELKI